MPQACADLSLPSRFALATYLAAIAPFTALALCKAIRSGDPYCDGCDFHNTTTGTDTCYQRMDRRTSADWLTGSIKFSSLLALTRVKIGTLTIVVARRFGSEGCYGSTGT